MYKILIYILAASIASALGDFPSGVTQCHRRDDTCLMKTTQHVLKNYYGGLRALNILPLDPLHVKSLVLPKNPSSPVNLLLNFTDMDVIGLQKAKVNFIKNFDLNERASFEAVVPEIKLKSKYVVDGRVLILPIVGKGDSLITCKNIRLNYNFDLKPVEKNGKIFSKIEHVKLELNPELVQYYLGGLFNGDEVLGDNMNKFLNDNWHDIYKELEAGFAKNLGLVVKQVINTVLSTLPFDELFIS